MPMKQQKPVRTYYTTTAYIIELIRSANTKATMDPSTNPNIKVPTFSKVKLRYVIRTAILKLASIQKYSVKIADYSSSIN